MPQSGGGRAQQTQAQLLKAAEAVFAEKGLAGARVDDIAARSGVNKRMIYAYFGDKEQLYMAVLQSVYSRLGECEEKVQVEELEETEAIAVLVRAYFDFLSANDSYVRMVMWENLNGARYLDQKGLSGVRDPMRRAMAALLQRGKASGRFRRDADETQVLLSLFALTFNYFSNLHTLTRVMHVNLADPAQKELRIASINDLLLAQLTEGIK